MVTFYLREDAIMLDENDEQMLDFLTDRKIDVEIASVLEQIVMDQVKSVEVEVGPLQQPQSCQPKKQQPRMNQYELVLAMTEYIRQNPDALLSTKLKLCKSQSEQVLLFSPLFT